MTEQKPYNDYSSWVLKTFGTRVQKISVDAGFTCPNRDGSKGKGGCIYCDNTTFSPTYCKAQKSITEQIAEGIAFFSAKYPTQKYMAYFQSYSNTYAPIGILEKLYTEALAYPGVIGLVVSTRPDCISEDILYLLQQLSKTHFVSVELGVESTSDKTLKFLNRCHTFAESIAAIKLTHQYGIHVGTHMILGLPDEDHDQMMEHAKQLSKLPINTLKLHQLQIIKGTLLSEMYNNNPAIFYSYTVDEYVELVVDFLEYLSPHIVIERFTSESPLNKVIAPNWGGLKNFEVVEKIKKRIKERGTFHGSRTLSK